MRGGRRIVTRGVRCERLRCRAECERETLVRRDELGRGLPETTLGDDRSDSASELSHGLAHGVKHLASGPPANGALVNAPAAALCPPPPKFSANLVAIDLRACGCES